MPTPTHDFEPDLDQLTEEFTSLAVTDVDAALALWDARSRRLGDELGAAWGALILEGLRPATRDALRSRPRGTTLLFTWSTQRSQKPPMPRLPFFSPRLGYAYCASLVRQRGAAAARRALREGCPLVVALRRDTSTLANNGRGLYDDHIVVLNGRGGLRSARFFPGCTEPGAQYAQRAAPAANGTRVDARYADVRFKKADGVDIDKDGIADAGRLVEGTYVFREKLGGFLGGRAFQSSTDQVAERDTNGDGFFLRDDPKRIDAKGAGRSMYIHRGGDIATRDVNTWSAGCQTLPKDIYAQFLATLGQPTSFCYVLINAR